MICFYIHASLAGLLRVAFQVGRPIPKPFARSNLLGDFLKQNWTQITKV